jgi:hypothetical protein
MDKTIPKRQVALFPLAIALISLFLFIALYAYLTSTSIDPRYFGNLIFAVPFVCYGVIFFFALKGKLENGIASVLTGVLIVVFGIATVLTLGVRSIREATATTTDVRFYERVLKLRDYPDNVLIRYFPPKIPAGAEDVTFSYNPAFGQGGENVELKFDADSDSIKRYADFFSRAARWEGKQGSSEAEKNGIMSGDFAVFGYRELPQDFTIYLLYSHPYRPGDWNHGEVSLVAVSEERSEIIFHAEDW